MIGSSARNDGLFRVIVVSGRILTFSEVSTTETDKLRLDFLNRLDRRPPLDVVEAAEDCTTCSLATFPIGGIELSTSNCQSQIPNVMKTRTRNDLFQGIKQVGDSRCFLTGKDVAAAGNRQESRLFLLVSFGGLCFGVEILIAIGVSTVRRYS